MINQSFYRGTPTSLDINGPVLSFTQTPSGISGQVGDTVSFVGVATATFLGAGNTATPTGSIAYRWYEGSVPLSDGNRLSGTATNTLVLSNLQTSDSSRVFYLEARFNPSAYGNGKNGRAINEPIYSNVVGSGVQLPPPPGASISASSTSIAYNGSVTISWSTSGATSLSSNFGRSELNGSVTISNLISSRTFTVTASNQGGSTTRSVTVNVAAAPQPPTVNLSVSPSSIANGGSAQVSWNTTNATSLTSNFGTTELNGATTFFNLTSSQTYSITASGPGGSTTRSATVNVAAPPAPTVNLSVSPSSIANNGSATLTWSSSNATSVSSSNFGATTTSGSVTFTNLTSSQTYSITVNGPGGSANANTFLSVDAPPPPPSAPTASLSASSTSIAYNGSVTLNWSTSGATSLTSNFGQTALNGSVTLNNLTSTATYEINATGPGGTTTRRVTITVAARPVPTASLSASSTSIAYNGSVTLTWSTSDADSLTSNFGQTALSGSVTLNNLTSSQTYQISASNTGGTRTRSVTVTVAARPAPTASLSVSPSSIANGGSTTITWSTSDAESLTSNFGETALSGSRTITNLTSSQTYQISASNTGGTTTRSATVTVAAPLPVIRITSQPSNASATFNKCTGSGGSVTFSVGATVDNPTSATLSYQWFLNGSALANSTDVSGVTGTTLTLKVLENQGGNNTVFVRVSYSGASTIQSNNANYTVNVIEPRPIITQTLGDPLDQTVFVGETATFNIRASASDGRALNYQWTNDGRPFVNGTNTSAFPFGTISGATTPTLTYTPSSTSASGIIYAIITDPSSNCTASNSPFQSEAASFNVNNVPTKFIRFAQRNANTTSLSYGEVNLNTFTFGSSIDYEFFAPFEDIQVDIKMEAAAGANNGSFRGGEGGQSIVRLTLRRNTEYVIRTPISDRGACFLYEQARLIAVVGGGGRAGSNGNGGRGGGCNVAGESGSGSGGGRGGSRSAALPGYFPGGDKYIENTSSISGGLVSSCTIGGSQNSSTNWWEPRFSPCSVYGNSALGADGNPISGSALISRGFKEGLGHRNNGGFAQSSNDGGGASGCEGGSAAQPGSRAGGGGGGGFASGVSVVATRLGGNTRTNGQFTIALPGRLSL
jgi:hypothetical protein